MKQETNIWSRAVGMITNEETVNSVPPSAQMKQLAQAPEAADHSLLSHRH